MVPSCHQEIGQKHSSTWSKPQEAILSIFWCSHSKRPGKPATVSVNIIKEKLPLVGVSMPLYLVPLNIVGFLFSTVLLSKLCVWPWKVSALIHCTTQSFLRLILLLMKDNIIMLAKSMVMPYDRLPPSGSPCILLTLSRDCWTAGKRNDAGGGGGSAWLVRQWPSF